MIAIILSFTHSIVISKCHNSGHFTSQNTILLHSNTSKILTSCIYINWRANVASETLTGVKMKKSGMFVYLYIWTYVCHFVL